MNRSLSNHEPIWAASIHDASPQGFLSFDLKDILDCLGRRVVDLMWLISDLDCTGRLAQNLCDQVEASKGGVMLPGQDFLAAAELFEQTIDGSFSGLPAGRYDEAERVRISQSFFSESPARLRIQAVDSTFFEVATKEAEDLRLLKQRFHDIREEDPRRYTMHVPS